jgi:hypothetical protein
MAYQHIPAKQYTRKAEYFSKGFDRFYFEIVGTVIAFAFGLQWEEYHHCFS